MSLATQQLFFTFELCDKLKAILITCLTEFQGTNMTLVDGYICGRFCSSICWLCLLFLNGLVQQHWALSCC